VKGLAGKYSPSCFTLQIVKGAISRHLVIKDTKHARTASSQQSAPRTCFKQRHFSALDLRLYLKDHPFKIIAQRPRLLPAENMSARELERIESDSEVVKEPAFSDAYALAVEL
jgi:hypothetical protein